MKAIRLGLVGSGGMARRRAAAFAAMEGCKLTALAARNAHTGAELAQRHEVELLGHWQALIERADIDAVAICTNNDSHAPIAEAALKAGKHVFLEYPLARRLDEGEALVDLARATGKVLRVAHPEVVSAEHRQLKEAAASLGGLLVALFTRLTPGRGARPEVLFNLRVSGPPTLFFVYHVYPLVDLFGPAAWVEGYAHYDGLNADGAYERFVNRAVVGFAGGGTAQWTWAGGIAISRAEQYEHLVLEGGDAGVRSWRLVPLDRGWCGIAASARRRRTLAGELISRGSARRGRLVRRLGCGPRSHPHRLGCGGGCGRGAAGSR